ncbi:GGDEF domain-containing protein [Novosphingobium aquimarinum]|uniref:GGDEF domain-containing protein n=1 Tax=Novosphingobium aquimarinum TaxID=2682494 RepID=UPI0012EBB533|nr:GGDEF domain-containing protein [Novosphingobium aquimarinum]
MSKPKAGAGGEGVVVAMLLNFTLEETGVLYGLIAEGSGDVILKTDTDGFIVHASPGFESLGYPLPSVLIGPHLSEIARPEHAPIVRQTLEGVLSGRLEQEWIEFAARAPDSESRRFAMQMRALHDRAGGVYGVLVVMRCVEETRALEEELFVTAMTDTLTKLTNRKAFLSMLQHLLDDDSHGFLALFTIDHFRAINLNHGQAMGDKVLCAFADFLRSTAPADAIVSRIGSDIFAVLYPHTPRDRAEASCRDMIGVLAEVSSATSGDNLSITASAGLGELRGTVDQILQRAELALFKARASGPSGFQSDIAKRCAPILRSA